MTEHLDAIAAHQVAEIMGMAERQGLDVEMTNPVALVSCLFSTIDTLKRRIAECDEQSLQACETPPDDCDCPGCKYAAEVNRA